jgi:hypothetical protein
MCLSSSSSPPPELEKMLDEVDFHTAQFEELHAILKTEWKRLFMRDFTKLSNAEIRKTLKQRNLGDLLVLLKEMELALDRRHASFKPMALERSIAKN